MKNKFIFHVSMALAFCISITGCDGELAKPEPPPTCEEQGLTGNYPYCEKNEFCTDTEEQDSIELAESHPFEVELACLIRNHPGQQRETMSYHPILGEIARMRAMDMAEHGYYGPSHTDRHGYGPDYYICQAGYFLIMEGYCETLEPTNNTLESIAAGLHANDTPQEVLKAWLNSPGHKRHLLAESDEFNRGTFYGIGYAQGTEKSAYDHYWVFIAPQSIRE